MTRLSKLNQDKVDFSPSLNQPQDNDDIDKKIIEDIKMKVDQLKNQPSGKDE